MCAELKGDLGYTDRKPFIIFGAGIYGERAAGLLGDKAIYFVDNDPGKVGKRKCGKKILSFEAAVKLSDRYDFFIAIYPSYIYEIRKQLNDAGVPEYTTLQSYMADMKD